MNIGDQTSPFGSLTESIHIVGEIFGVFGVAIMVIGIGISTVWFVKEWYRGKGFEACLQEYKNRIGRAMLLSLEVLIAADIVGTVALTPTMQNIATLGVIVLVRTFLSWALTMEIEGHWPWQKAKDEKSGRHGNPEA